MFRSGRSLIFLTTVLTNYVILVVSNQRQIEIYDTRSISGSSFWVGSTNSIPYIDNIPELSNAKEMLFCHEGVWMVHTNPNYMVPISAGPVNSGPMSSLILHTNSGCDQPNFPTQGKSFRALSSTNTSTPTISLFDLPNMGGTMTQFTEDVPNYFGDFLSIVVTSPGEVELFTLPDYGGFSFCLTPSIGHSVHWTWDITSLEIQQKSIRSFKFKCSGEVIIPIPTHTFQSSPSSFV